MPFSGAVSFFQKESNVYGKYHMDIQYTSIAKLVKGIVPAVN
jgi:hypothetical protein